MIITSRHHPLFKDVLNLKNKKRSRVRDQKILVQGLHALSNISKQGTPLDCLLFGEALTDEEKSLLSCFVKMGTSVHQISDTLMEELIYGEMPDHLLGVAGYPKSPFTDLKVSSADIFIILDSIEKPGNVGAILRTADATGVKAVMACDMQTDPFHPNVIRSSMGCALTMPYGSCQSGEAMLWMKNQNVQGYTLSPEADNTFWDMSFSLPLFIVVGNESKGLSKPWRDNNWVKPVSIPMLGCADSLNASVSLTVVLFEIIRQSNIHA